MTSFLLSAFIYLPKIVLREQIEAAIVFFSFPCGFLGLWGKRLFGIPYVISLRGGDVPGNEPGLDHLHKALQPLRRLIMKKSMTIVANSNGLKRMSEQADPFPVQVIPNGVDTVFFSPEHHSNDNFRFLFVGRFQEQKNLFFLLENVNSFAQSTTREFELHMVGDGPQKKALRDYAERLMIRDRIKWHGWCDKETLRAVYRQSDCILNPSFYEGMPNVLLEAMACALPAIASNVIGNNEVVCDGVTGYLFNLHQPQSFQTSLQSIIDNAEIAGQFAINARKRVEQDFSWTTMAGRYEDLFKERRTHAV